MAEAASAWKNLDVAKQQEYKDKGALLSVVGAADEISPSPKSKPAAKDAPSTATKTKTGNPNPTSISISIAIPTFIVNKFVIERYLILTVPVFRPIDHIITGYQVFVAESMKQGSTMGEAASAWKNLDVARQQEFKDKGALLSVVGAADEISPSPKTKPAAKDAPSTATKTKTGNPNPNSIS